LKNSLGLYLDFFPSLTCLKKKILEKKIDDMKENFTLNKIGHQLNFIRLGVTKDTGSGVIIFE